MRKRNLILLTVTGWLIVTSLYAYYYIVTILALPEEYDAYARNWQFQLFAFMVVRFPYMVLILMIAIGVVIVLPHRREPGSELRR
jgi:hypothetical protein